MASIRFSIFSYAVISMLLHRVAYSLQEDTENMSVMSRDKVFRDRTVLSRYAKDLVSVGVEVVGKHKILGKRKMMEKMNEEHINGEEKASKTALFTIANPKIGDHKLPKRTRKMQHQYHHHDHHNHHHHKHHHHHAEVKMRSSYMALNADYHVPGSHPPKNN